MDLFNKLKEKKILLIDDDECIRDSLSLFFKNEGCHLLAIDNAEEALKLLTKQSYEIIITDYRLPGMDGLEFFKKIQNSHPRVVKILVTAYGSKDVLSEAMKIGIQEIIKKPFTTQVIEESLSRLI